MERKKIYNPESEEKTSERKIFGGDPTGIFELNDIKYQWAYNLWEMMLNNSWYPKEVDMTRDVNDYKHLTDAEKSAYHHRRVNLLTPLVKGWCTESAMEITSLGVQIHSCSCCVCSVAGYCHFIQCQYYGEYLCFP